MEMPQFRLLPFSRWGLFLISGWGEPKEEFKCDLKAEENAQPLLSSSSQEEV